MPRRRLKSDLPPDDPMLIHAAFGDCLISCSLCVYEPPGELRRDFAVTLWRSHRPAIRALLPAGKTPWLETWLAEHAPDALLPRADRVYTGDANFEVQERDD